MVQQLLTKTEIKKLQLNDEFRRTRIRSDFRNWIEMFNMTMNSVNQNKQTLLFLALLIIGILLFLQGNINEGISILTSLIRK